MTTAELARPMMPREHLQQEVPEVARHLLGAVVQSGVVALRITEVEAYGGPDDPGSHARRGPTPRCRVMFGPAGRAYVYFVYGMHHCLNVVCAPSGTASAVLVRAGEVLEGESAVRGRRDAGRAAPQPLRELARGPARLAQALGVDLRHNDVDLCDPQGPLRLHVGPSVPEASVCTGPRVGVRGPGGEGATYPWRFWVDGERTVSAYRPAAARPRVPRKPAR
jgi:DNA-3-methyladenine glycosylase